MAAGFKTNWTHWQSRQLIGEIDRTLVWRWAGARTHDEFIEMFIPKTKSPPDQGY